MAAQCAPAAALSTHESASWRAVELPRFPVHRSVQFSLLRSSTACFIVQSKRIRRAPISGNASIRAGVASALRVVR